jgi:hypothetical protein
MTHLVTYSNGSYVTGNLKPRAAASKPLRVIEINAAAMVKLKRRTRFIAA